MKRRHVVVVFLCLLGVILYVDRICISVALPRIQDELHIPPELLGWVGAAYSLSYALFEIPARHLGPVLVMAGVTAVGLVPWWFIDPGRELVPPRETSS